jgi:hypothetical protein
LYSTPPKGGHLSRTGHMGVYYMLVDTVPDLLLIILDL